MRKVFWVSFLSVSLALAFLSAAAPAVYVAFVGSACLAALAAGSVVALVSLSREGVFGWLMARHIINGLFAVLEILLKS